MFTLITRVLRAGMKTLKAEFQAASRCGRVFREVNQRFADLIPGKQP